MRRRAACAGAARWAMIATIMSRAFIKEQDGGPEDLPDRPVSPHRNLVTVQGLAAIDAELTRLHRAQADALAADDKTALARAARDLRYWTARRATAELVPPPEDTDVVRFGSTVTIGRDDGRRQTFRIVGEDEANPAAGTLSYVSPVAHALIGKSVGDVVTAGNSEAEILEIRSVP